MDVGGPLLLVGCGKMGGALLAGWIDRGLDPAAVTVIEPEPAARSAAAVGAGVACLAGMDALASEYRPAVIVLAVKPQQMDAVLEACRGRLADDPVVLSIAAGRTLAYYARRLGPAAVVRAMPNTPAAVGRGMTVLVANAAVSTDQARVCEALMAAVGEVAWVEDEALLDAVTAVSGGGPAYVFLLIETLARAGTEAGLPEDLAMRLADRPLPRWVQITEREISLITAITPIRCIDKAVHLTRIDAL